jgi:hypothetical protein
MKLKYDPNGFVIGMTTNENAFDLPTGYGEFNISDDFAINIFDENYGIPLYKHVNGEIIEIVDYDDYLLNYNYSRLYKIKAIDNYTKMIITKTNQELKDAYDLLSTNNKLIFVEALNTYWANDTSQFNVNLVYEGVIRILMEVLYIREISQRSLTQDEQDTYFGMLNEFHEHVANMAGFTPDSWCLTHLIKILDACDDIRFNKLIPQRYFIAGY